MDVNAFLYLLIIGWFFLIGAHIALVQEKSVVGLLYGFISCVLYIPALLDMQGYFPPPSALNEYMRGMAYLFMPASLFFLPIVLISIIVTIVKTPKSSKLKLPDNNTIEPLHDINSELIEAVVKGDIYLVKKLVSQGANPKVKNQLGYSAEDFARGHCYRHISKFFQEHSLNGNQKN